MRRTGFGKNHKTYVIYERDMRRTGFGKNHKTYVIYERGGAEDPYQQSVVVLRLAVKSLEQDIHPDELPEEYFGMKGPVAGDFERQKQIIQQQPGSR